MTNLETISIIVTAVSIAVSVITSIVAIIATKKAREVFKFRWVDIQVGVRKLAIKIFNTEKPDIIFCSSGPSAIVANLLMIEANTYVPILLGLSERTSKREFAPPIAYKIVFETKIWKTCIPENIYLFKDKKLLIVEDCAITGTTLSGLKDEFIKIGFERNSVKTMSLVVNKLATKKEICPDFYHYEVNVNDVYFPWGKGRGNEI